MSKATWGRQRLVAACLMLLVASALGTMLFRAAVPSSAVTATLTYDAAAYTYDASLGLSTQDVAASSPRGSPATLPAAPREDSVSLGRFGDATNTGADIGRANFAQRAFSETFSRGGAFSGRTIDDVAGSLRSGAMSSKDVPIDVIVRDGNTLILNTRSSQALMRAGISRSSWNVIDRTGQAAYETRLSSQLGRNGLTSLGTELP